MQGQGWVKLIRRIPAKLQDAISFITVSGKEVLAQNIVHLDDEFIVLRGRMAGTQDAGRIIILPYDQIVNLAITKVLKEKEVLSIFGDDDRHPERVEQQDERQEDMGSEEETEPVEDEALPEAEAPNTLPADEAEAKPAADAPKGPVSKSLLLARLRQRLAEKKQPS